MMHPKINLHTHTSHSDGSLPVAEVMQILQEKGYDMIALTDHDTVVGNTEAAKHCADMGMKFVPGVELTTYLAKEIGILDPSYKVHMIGLGIDSAMIHSVVQKTEKRKVEFHTQLLSKWLSDEEIRRCNLHNRIACSEQLVQKGLFKNIGAVLPFFSVSSYCLSIPDTIRVIHDAGGVAIWAHPYYLPHNGGHRISHDEVRKIYAYMKAHQLDGMEAYYATFSADEQAFLASLCEEDGLFCSTGTDFHGDYPSETLLLDQTQSVDMRLLSRLGF
jgi:predicted metal-dependent phosphoesterase TrpH